MCSSRVTRDLVDGDVLRLKSDTFRYASMWNVSIESRDIPSYKECTHRKIRLWSFLLCNQWCPWDRAIRRSQMVVDDRPNILPRLTFLGRQKFSQRKSRLNSMLLNSTFERFTATFWSAQSDSLAVLFFLTNIYFVLSSRLVFGPGVIMSVLVLNELFDDNMISFEFLLSFWS